MEMVSLKRSLENRVESANAAMDEPEYEYGSRIHLDGDVVKKLGLDGVSAGDAVDVAAKGIIESISVNSDKTGKRFSVCIQLTDMAVEREQRMDAGSVLYGGGD